MAAGEWFREKDGQKVRRERREQRRTETKDSSSSVQVLYPLNSTYQNKCHCCEAQELP